MACKKFTNVKFSEIYKRVPPNQLQKFMEFREKNAEYKKILQKYPEHLPKIDWEYYRGHVRSEYVQMVDEFEKKYEELNKVFDSRDQLDTAKYFEEIEKAKLEVKVDIEKYIVESNKRIKQYEAEIERIKNMIPYEQMTMEDFYENYPKRHIQGKRTSFWPHTPEEQKHDEEGLKAATVPDPTPAAAASSDSTPSGGPELKKSDRIQEKEKPSDGADVKKGAGEKNTKKKG